MERAVILATSPTLDLECDAELSTGPAAPAADLPAPSLEAVERREYDVSDGLIIDGRPRQARQIGLWYWAVDSNV
jgi:hypothetical protein